MERGDLGRDFWVESGKWLKALLSSFSSWRSIKG
jgi:hypothetical protein